MRSASQWNPADLDDEVLDRVHKILTGRREHIDSPHGALQPAWDARSPSNGIGASRAGMGLA